MTDGEAGQAGAAGGSARHIPVLLGEVIAHLAPHDGGVYIDGTFGAGGYSAALLAAADTRVVGIDRDPAAIAAAQSQAAAAAGRLTLVRGEFAALDRIAHDLGLESVDGVVLDLGVSSMQLDTPERGFSFRLDGPLDMRMGARRAVRRRRGRGTQPSATSPTSFSCWARSAARAPSPAPSWRRAANGRSRPPARSPTSYPGSCTPGPATFTRPRARSRRSACSSTTSLGNWPPASPRRSAS